MKKESLIKNDNYYQISGWMLNDLHLSGITLNVFAIIYGFTQDGESEFSGSRQYLCDFTGTTKPTIDKALKDLCELKFIIKISDTKNNVTFNKYRANLDYIRNFTGGKESLLGGKESLYGGGKESLPNNIDTNNKEKNVDKRKYIKEKSDYWTKIYKDRNFCDPLQYGYGLGDPNEPKLSDEIF